MRQALSSNTSIRRLRLSCPISWRHISSSFRHVLPFLRHVHLPSHCQASFSHLHPFISIVHLFTVFSILPFIPILHLRQLLSSFLSLFQLIHPLGDPHNFFSFSCSSLMQHNNPATSFPKEESPAAATEAPASTAPALKAPPPSHPIPPAEDTPLVKHALAPTDPRLFRPALLGSTQPRPDIHSHFGVKAFLQDISNIQSGTIPVSLLIATVIGILCGVAAYLYYVVLEFFLEYLWKTLPETVAHAIPFWSTSFYWLWIPFMGMICAAFVGITINVLGPPGDLAYTVGCVHTKGYVPMGHSPSMIAASQISILGGGSLGPEAPLVAICASIAGWVSMSMFGQKYKNVVRKHTLCGMACALAAFFGVPLGGSLFALEVNSRLGVEYFEHVLEAIASGTICLVVFRSLAGLPIGPIYFFTDTLLRESTTPMVMLGALLGLFGAGVGAIFAHGHKALVKKLNNIGWGDDPVKLSIFGGIGVCTLGVLIPQTMFWGEFEMQTIGSLSPASQLPHIWPTTGAFSFEITGFWTAMLVGIAKMVAVSFTVAGGYRGGFIFPFFAAGAAFGRAIWFLFPSIPPVVAILSVACGINVTITRTALATPLILCGLAGEVNATPPVLAASLVSAFVTYYMPFIGPQQGREQLFESQLHSYTFKDMWGEPGESPLVETGHTARGDEESH